MHPFLARVLQTGVPADHDSTAFVAVLAFVSLSGGLLFGYNTGVIAPALSQLSVYFGTQAAGGTTAYLSSFTQGLVTCSALLGAMIGSAGGSGIVSLLGYKFTMLLLGLLTIIGAISSSLVDNLIALIILRIVLGLGIGLSTVACPGYVGEMSPPKRKGTLGALFQLSLTLGILISYIVGLALFLTIRDNAELQWRLDFGIGLVPGALCVICFFFMPEANSWLNNKTSSSSSSSSYADDDAYYDSDNARSTPQLTLWKNLFFERKNRKALGLGTMMAVGLQLTGINAFIYFSPAIFATAGFPPGNLGQGPLVTTTFVGLWNFLSTIVCAALVDRVGRRPLLLTGLAAMSWACVTMGFIWIFVDGVAKGGFAIGLTFIYILAFEASIGSLFWVILTELFPLEVKDVGLAWCNLLQWTLNLLLSAFYLPISEQVGDAPTFFVFGLIGLVCIAVFFFALPETSKKESGYVAIDSEENSSYQAINHGR